MSTRDWAKQPPASLEEAFQLAEHLANGACESIFQATGERPQTERRGMAVVVVWPDGEATNMIEVSYAQ